MLESVSEKPFKSSTNSSRVYQTHVSIRLLSAIYFMTIGKRNYKKPQPNLRAFFLLKSARKLSLRVITNRYGFEMKPLRTEIFPPPSR